MKTTGSGSSTYIGVDLTDAYARSPRPIDVCGLDADADKLRARFWTWTYEGDGTSDVSLIVDEIRGAQGTVIDGPQALAAKGAKMRESERLTSAAGKTPESLPSGDAPFAGFVRSSVELFRSLDGAGIPIVRSDEAATGSVAEQYPGGNWYRLTKGAAGKLPKKKTAAGLAARKAILEALGVVFPEGLTLRDDHLDACLGAVIAAAAHGAVAGGSVRRVGTALERDASGVLREGLIWLLDIDDEARARVQAAVAPHVTAPSPRERTERPAPTQAMDTTEDGPTFVRIGSTKAMLDHGTKALSVAGLSHLRASADARRKVLLPELEGHLWLGDHTMLWEKHQEADEVAVRTYAAVKEQLDGEFDDFEVNVEALPES